MYWCESECSYWSVCSWKSRCFVFCAGDWWERPVCYMLRQCTECHLYSLPTQVLQVLFLFSFFCHTKESLLKIVISDCVGFVSCIKTLRPPASKLTTTAASVKHGMLLQLSSFPLPLAHTYTHMRTCTCTHTNTHTRIHTHTHTHTHHTHTHTGT